MSTFCKTLTYCPSMYLPRQHKSGAAWQPVASSLGGQSMTYGKLHLCRKNMILKKLKHITEFSLISKLYLSKIYYEHTDRCLLWHLSSCSAAGM